MLNKDYSPLILNTDGSVLPITEQDIYLSLRDWEEIIRFGCSFDQWKQFSAGLCTLLPATSACTFIGSGDFHHLTLLLLKQFCGSFPLESVDLVVLDNHPDNMRYIFGIHCGSWVSFAVKLPFIRRVFVIGITSEDITFKHCWENRLMPFYRNKLKYFSINTKAEWLNTIFPQSAVHFSTPKEMTEYLSDELQSSEYIYLSIDKDVFSQNTLITNWDQGVLEFSDFENIIKVCEGKIIGADVTGDMSVYTYRSRLKQFLSKLDGQEEGFGSNIEKIRREHQRINRRIFELIIKNPLRK